MAGNSEGALMRSDGWESLVRCSIVIERAEDMNLNCGWVIAKQAMIVNDVEGCDSETKR